MAEKSFFLCETVFSTSVYVQYFCKLPCSHVGHLNEDGPHGQPVSYELIFCLRRYGTRHRRVLNPPGIPVTTVASY